MTWLPKWLLPWWAAPAPGAERGLKVFDEDGSETTEPDKMAEILEREFGRGRIDIYDVRGEIIAT